MSDQNFTRYSEKIEGDHGNYGWQTRFDISDNGYLGINQYEAGGLTDRILLSPNQVRELIEFVCRPKTKRAA
jgi:hypothetical protein